MTSPGHPDTVRELRADIPAFQDSRYFNYGAHGPSPESVADAAADSVRTHEYEVPATGDPYEYAFDRYERTRTRVAELLGVDPSTVALTDSTAAGISAIASAIDWTPGDVVVRTDLEHPAGVLPWQRLARRGVEVRVVESEGGHLDLEAFAEAVAGADLVCFSALTWTHGTMLPVADLVSIAREAGAFTLVDAVQVPGQTPVDLTEWGADAVAAAGHKWLLGLWGGGFLYVDPDAAPELTPAAIGYRSVETPTAEEYRLKDGARRFEVGTVNPGPYAALAKAIDIVTTIGVDQIEYRIERLTARLADGVPNDCLLSSDPPESGLVTIDVEDPEATVARLREAGIVIRELPDPDAVRASVHAVNTTDDIDALVDALDSEW